MKWFKLALALCTTLFSGLNAIGWAYAPNYWHFGLAFMGFGIMAAICWMGVVGAPGPSPRGVPVQVYSCARCTQDHQMYFVTFAYHPVTSQDAVEFTHWGMCPVLNEPVLMRIVDTETKHAESY